MTARTRPVLAAVIGVSFLGVAAGCGERSEPLGPAADLFPVTVTTAADRPVVLNAPPRRIAILSDSARSILDALGAGHRVVGMPVDRAGRLQARELRELEPDLVIAAAATEESVLSRAEEVTKAPVYVFPDSSLRELERTITQLGLITAQPAAARRVVRRIESRRGEVAERLRGRKRVSAFVDLGFFTTVSDQSLIGDLLREARGRNVAGLSADAGPFDVPSLVRLDPDVYITTSDSGTTLRELRKSPKAKRIGAIRKGRFVVVDHELLEPTPSIGEGLLALARALHPDAFR